MICQFEYIILLSEREDDLYILENSNPGKHLESKWTIFNLSKSGPSEFSYSSECQLIPEKREELNNIIHDYLNHRLTSDKSVLCLYMPQKDYSKCVRRIENLLKSESSNFEKDFSNYFRNIF